jgi:pyridoxamine 5'-phosphate oxidase
MAAAAPWKSALEEVLKNNPDTFLSKLMQLATVKPDGRPSNRTLVFRGFLGATDGITFFGDFR